MHAVLTRFNLGTPADVPWLEHRIRLFERFCLPSLRSQSCQDFVWLIFCDAATREPWRSRLLAYASANTRLVWVPYGSGDVYRTQESDCYAAAVQELLSGDEAFVLTTRCDNDDAVSSDFVETLQEALRPGTDREFLNLFDGYVWHQGSVSPAYMWSNSFLSYLEPVTAAGPVLTVMHVKHPNASTSAPVRDFSDGWRYWLQVCHDRNLINRPGPHTYGIWQPERELESRFVVDLSVALERSAS